MYIKAQCDGESFTWKASFSVILPVPERILNTSDLILVLTIEQLQDLTAASKGDKELDRNRDCERLVQFVQKYW